LPFSASAELKAIGWIALIVEPQSGLCVQCQRNRPRSRVVQAALGAHGEQGQVSFTCVEFGEQGSPLSFRSAYADAGHLERCLSEDGKLQEIQVDVVSLDRLLEEVTAQVDLLVLDIEGHELNVLKGFSLKTFGPLMLMIEILLAVMMTNCAVTLARRDRPVQGSFAAMSCSALRIKYSV
jgi:FkbM family methyltransferase